MAVDEEGAGGSIGEALARVLDAAVERADAIETLAEEADEDLDRAIIAVRGHFAALVGSGDLESHFDVVVDDGDGDGVDATLVVKVTGEGVIVDVVDDGEVVSSWAATAQELADDFCH